MAPDILGIQIVGTLFGAFMLYYTFLNFKRHEMTAKEYGAWTFLWAVFLLVAIFPQMLEHKFCLFDMPASKKCFL